MSFVQVTTFGTAGAGGAVVTADPELGRAVRMLRNHGQDGTQRFTHHRIGYNSRFGEILAAFPLHRLPGLGARLQRRAPIAEYYTERFAPRAAMAAATTSPRCSPPRHEELAAHLAARGVTSHVHYPPPLPHQPAFAAYGAGGRWPHAEAAGARTLAIPVYPHLSDAQVEHIADALCDVALPPICPQSKEHR